MRETKSHEGFFKTSKRNHPIPYSLFLYFFKKFIKNVKTQGFV